ncbi:hypothetical protein B0H19DRAFT_1255150 [Mycena capillaripes]|nr:hypothetical protein B0H19DRAFT_1255150 [Mycena capillaripes]
MKPATSFVALLSLASLVVSSARPSQGLLSSCLAQDRVLVETRNVTAAGHEIQISTKACSADVLAASSRSLHKRQVFNACEGETTTYTCVINQGIGPLRTDCAALEAALPAFLASEGGPTSFTVSPQFVQEFTLGTCLWAWINTNPVGGATLQYCYVGVEVNGANLDNDCIVPGDTAGVAIPSNPQLNPVVLAWAFEVLHS